MTARKPVLFDEALKIAIKQINDDPSLFGKKITLVRDLRGRIRVLLPRKPSKSKNLDQFKNDIANALGAYGYPADQMVLFEDDLVQKGGKSLLSDARLLPNNETDLEIYLLDRQIIGQDWMRGELKRKTKNPRITFFGIKGGVGRSTVISIWAWWLAKQGKKILIFDLDLESPGVSSTLLPQDFLPDFGIVDWFVESGVGQSKNVEKWMIGSSPIASGLPGDIHVVPSFGSKTGDYLPKLARCYSEVDEEGSLSWAERVQKMVERMEISQKPDLVILDSRAGLHDIAAVLVTRMDAENLLFAVDSPQTWKAYSFLFQHWKNHPHVNDFRRRLQFVAGMVPETDRKQYLERFREHAWDVFRDSLYDEVTPEQTEYFSFDSDDEDAPHFPIPVFWHRALQEFDPVTSPDGVDEKTAHDALDFFIERVNRLVSATVGEDWK